MKNNKIFGKNHHTTSGSLPPTPSKGGGVLLPPRRGGLGWGLLLFLLAAAFPALAQDPPVHLLVCDDKGFQLTSEEDASGSGEIAYEWFENGSPLASSYNTAAISFSAADRGEGTYSYVRRATNSSCTVTSNTFTVVVLKPTVPEIAVTDACHNIDGLKFTIDPAANTTYTWTLVTGEPGTASGDDNSTYTVSSSETFTTSVKAAASVTYNIGTLDPKVCVSAFSEAALGKVNPVPTVAQVGDGLFCSSDDVTTLTVQVKVNGTVQSSGVTITWY